MRFPLPHLDHVYEARQHYLLRPNSLTMPPTMPLVCQFWLQCQSYMAVPTPSLPLQDGH